MTNIIDFEKVLQHRKTHNMVKRFTDAGLSSKDVATFACAAFRAFSSTIPAIEDVGNGDEAVKRLGYVYVSKSEEPAFDSYLLGSLELPMVQYIVPQNGGRFKWDESATLRLNLTDHPDPGREIVRITTDALEAMGIESVSPYGLFGLDVFYFACARELRPVYFGHYAERNSILLVLRDPENDRLVQLSARLSNWRATPQDPQGLPRELADT